MPPDIVFSCAHNVVTKIAFEFNILVNSVMTLQSPLVKKWFRAYFTTYEFLTMDVHGLMS